MRYAAFKYQANLIRSRLISLQKQIPACNEDETLTEAKVEKVKIINQTAIQKHGAFDQIVGKLFKSEPLPEDLDETELSNLQDEISNLYIVIHSACNALLPPEDTKLDQTSASNASSNNDSSTAVAIKLPRLNLGVFYGQTEKWTAFQSLFESSVHKNASIPDVQKFVYLLSSLNGEPLNLIKSLPVTSVNYNIAWQILIKRYHNSRTLISLHVNNILDMPNVPSLSVKHLRSFLTSLQENIGALKALDQDVTSDGLILTALLLRKFDFNFRSKFEHSRNDSQTVPQITELIEFIDRECCQLEAANLATAKPGVNTSYSFTSKPTQNKVTNKAVLFTVDPRACGFCASTEHTVYKCPDFVKLSPEARLKYIKGKNLCTNCMGRHSNYNCKSSRNCNVCNKRHHSLLHLPKEQQFPVNNSVQTNPANNNKGDSKHPQYDAAMVGTSQSHNNTVLLATALVHLSNDGHSTVARAVLDSAAQHSFISESCARLLNVRRNNSGGNNQILGISSSPVKTKGFCHVTLASLNGHVLASDHPVLILEKITNNLPRVKIHSDIKKELEHLVLADPTFDTPAPIDVLIGADLFAQALKGGSFSLGEAMPTVFNTIFGFVLLGSTPVVTETTSSACGIVTMLCIDDANLHQSIQRFWTLEEPPLPDKISSEQETCDEFFIATHSRLNTGRYMIRLPLKESPEKLGNSSKGALSMFKSLENRFHENPKLKEKYVDFMQDYLESGHMTECLTPLSAGNPNFFLPHHGVMREDKLRVVFNGSAVTSTGLSLNDILYQGPKLHNDIPDLIMHFRRHKIVFTCDIKQMFRQIQVHEDDQLLQLIYWRADPSLPLKIFQLTTVTYGLTSSPYLANRVIQQLIADEGKEHPAAASALKQQIYVDDALLGSDTLEGALALQQDVIDLMSRGGFSLRKWSSNRPEILAAVPEDHRGVPLQFPTHEQTLCNILGLKWLPEIDAFSYSVSVDHQTFTKRTVLSAIAKIYDPMGWLTPVVFRAKALMQYLWTLGLKWDDPLPNDVLSTWTTFLTELPLLEEIFIPRHLGITSNTKCQLHGFSDASEAGFSACVYLRIEHNDSKVQVYLLIAKSRVAPLKRVSLPRLELCGAHMLANLLQYCAKQLLHFTQVDNITAWCDSTITLAWIKTPTYRLKTYVANRVAQIQDISPPTMWSHIPSQMNPADCGSRGIFPSQLKNHKLWWSGPEWLKLPQTQWPLLNYAHETESSLPELKQLKSIDLVTTASTSFDLLNKFSSWITLIRVTAYILRFINNCKIKKKTTERLQLTDLSNATKRICFLIQKEHFQMEIGALKNDKLCTTRVNRLSPFLDKNGLIRVGGRLKNASIDYNAKHPILLPKKHHVINLIIDYYHKSFLHTGPHQLQALISQKYWILSARDIIRSRIHRCITCFRCRPPQTAPFMGELPTQRVTPSRPFSASGCDYAGPFLVKPHRLRKLQPTKTYLCIFICMATKAVHIETVSDLTSESFIATLTRFASRRGLPSHLYTDCGTAFVGAEKQLIGNFNALLKDPVTQRFAEERFVTFHFLPPRAPHQGGLWERAVRSSKHHLKRVIGTQILTIEEFNTLVTRVEAILNSRPLTQLSTDPSELSALTPGHFLIGGPLVAPAEADLQDISMNRLNRWQLVQAFTQNIWTRWKQEYLHTLQERSKWTKKRNNLQVGQLVVIHDSNSPPLTWKLGRIISISPGSDGVVRVVTMKTQKGTLTRPAVKVSPLPLD